MEEERGGCAGLDIHAMSGLRYVRPLLEGEELNRLEEEVKATDKRLDEARLLPPPEP